LEEHQEKGGTGGKNIGGPFSFFAWRCYWT